MGRLGLLALLGVFSTILVGCGGGLKLTPIKASSKTPSNVAVYFKVETSGGEPVGGLTAEQFAIYEDKGLVSQYESKQTILNPEVAVSHYTLLLVDMSGSVTESEGTVQTLTDAAGAFAERVEKEKQQKVGIYAFDGSADIHPIVPFSTGGAAKAGVKQLANHKAQDPSTNLHGAIVKGLQQLDTSLAHAEHPIRFGTLVVFSDGTDRANRVSADEMKKAVKNSQYDIFAIGLGPELSESQLSDIGKDGTAKATDKESTLKAFDTIAARIEGRTKSYYLLSYCSPSRAGKHKVKIEAHYKSEKDGDKSGELEQEFDATNFGKGCDPKTPPSFDVTKGDALAPKPEEKKEEEKKKGGSTPPPKQTAPANSGGKGPAPLPPPPPPADFKP